MQNSMRQYDKDCQVWLSKLQTVATPVKVGKIFYSGSIFNIKEQVQRVIAVTSKESLLQIEMGLTMEPTFCTEDERQLWYDKHSTRDLEDKKN
jgi:hypothetical protein